MDRWLRAQAALAEDLVLFLVSTWQLTTIQFQRI